MENGIGQEYDHPFKLLVHDTENDTEITKLDGHLSKLL